jgi:hypothetical protein
LTGNSEVIHLDEKRPTRAVEESHQVAGTRTERRLFAQVDFRREMRPIAFVDPAPLARIYPFGWQGASARMVNMKSPTRFEVGANTGVVQVSRGVLHLESVP